MWSSRLLWKLLLTCVGANIIASVLFAVLITHSWKWGLAAVVCICLAGLAWWLAAHIVRPLSSLSAAAEALARGNYEQRVYVENRDELGALARTLNRIGEDLEQRSSRLGQAGEQHSTVLGGMIEGVIAVDMRQRVVLANRAAGRLFDFRPAAAEGRSLLEVVRQHALHEAVEAALARREPQKLEMKTNLQHPGSNNQCIDIHVQPLPGEPCPGAVLVMHDTTELRRLESLRRDFMANVSHELKTPLSSIKAYTETLRDGALHDTETAQRFLARIEEQADRLHHLILDMLMLARVESEQQAFEIVSVEVAAVARACVEDHRAAAEAKSIHLGIEPEQPASQVRADREALRDMLDNLIDNAIKYTPTGGAVTVSWQRVESDGAPPFVRIAVRDTGIGIKPDDQRRVFERFYRVDKARSRELGGTGLGLAIVKHLAHSLGGRVGVESEFGKGSTFTIELPNG